VDIREPDVAALIPHGESRVAGRFVVAKVTSVGATPFPQSSSSRLSRLSSVKAAAEFVGLRIHVAACRVAEVLEFHRAADIFCCRIPAASG